MLRKEVGVSFTARELWTVVHGMGLGAIFLLAFAGGLAGLWSLRPEYVTPSGVRERMRRLVAGTWIMAAAAWLTVISGTWVVYIWYRLEPPAGAELRDYPRYYLLENPNLAAWHTFGMEWKEHVAWLSPMLATAVAFVVLYYGSKLVYEGRIRRSLMILFTIAFVAAGIAGAYGAFITKVAPIL
jgi:hypothetical protein